MIGYRTDIDGMRAIAVLAVLLFHVDSEWLPGGFIGVDIFFVISGFLISGNILDERAAGRFTFSEFYRRRIRRILPAMLAVIVATLIMGHFILLPGDVVRLSESALAASLSLANVYFAFFLDTSYFAASAAEQPLLHLWSLGVEEQFYLLWPALLLLILRFGVPAAVGITAVVITISFALAEYLLPTEPMFAYYMLPTRAGQLLLGALCAFWLRSELHLPKSLAFWFQLGGLVMIFGSLLQLSDESAFPGVRALPVTVGSAILILGGAGSAESYISRLLSWTPARQIGLISYSLYLWHWPILAFARYVYGELTIVHQAPAVALIFFCSYLSYKFVELPYRRTQNSLGRVMLSLFVLPASCVMLLGGFLLITNGYGLYQFSDAYVAGLEQQPKRAGSEKYVCQKKRVMTKHMQNRNCVIGARYSTRESTDVSYVGPEILVWGDSNSAHYVGFLGEMADQYGFAFRNIAHGLCLPILDRPERYAPSRRAEDCKYSGETVRGELHHYDTVIISGAWMRPLNRFADFEDALRQSIEELVSSGKRVILLGRVPFFPDVDALCGAKALKLPFLDCRSRGSVSLESVEEYNGILRGIASAAGAGYYDISELVCDSTECSSYLGNELLYRDPGHIGMRASIILGGMAREQEAARRVFAPLAGKLAGGIKRSLPWRSDE